ncbi:autotransporter outer membrane beta-barrel domain-containing protein [Candidatus Pelagibacter sp.]|nr:autotransporter outer membrane beta-barrel domain-containing protein [Candidatus Pelagibacter sp.]
MNKIFNKINSFSLSFLTFVCLFAFFYNSNVEAADCSSTYSASATLNANCSVPSGGTTINNGVTITTGSYKFNLNIGNFINNGTVTSTGLYTFNKHSAGSGTMTNFTNTGTISSTTSGYQVSFQNSATLTNFNNSGTISTAAYGMVLSNDVTITNFTNSGNITTSGLKALILQSNSTITNFYNFGTISGGGSNADIGFHSTDSSIVNFYNDQNDLVISGKNPDNYYIKVNSTSDYGALKAHSTDAMTFAGIESSSSLSVGTYSNVVTNISSSYISAAEGTYGLYDWSFVNSGGNNWDLVVSRTESESVVDPITDKDVVGSIDTQSQLAKNIVTQSTSTVSSRLNYLRQNRGNDNLSKNNIKLDFGNAILTSLTNELLAKNDKSIIPDNWSSWSEGSLSSSKIGDSANSSSSETDAQALAFGFDTKLNDNDLLGFAIQYGKSDTDVGSSGSKTDSENINFSVYRTRPLDNDNFIEGMFGVGLIESDLTRISGSNTLTGSRNGTQIFGSINYGRTLDKGDFNLTPIARVDLGYTELDAYSESGTDALSYGKQSIENGLASAGLQFSDIVKFNDNKLKPFGSIEFGMDFSNSSNAKMNYVSDTSTIYTYTQGANSNHLITSVVGFEYITINNLEIISSYKRIQGNESEQTDIINVSVNFKSKRETEYAMSVDGSEDLKAGFDISKNVNGFDLKFNANQSLSENSDQTANVSLSRSF